MTPPIATPVFNCVVNVAPAGTGGSIIARVANLAGIETSGRTEREALAAAVAEFKATVAKYHAAGEAIPWLTEPLKPAPGETQRFIAIHL